MAISRASISLATAFQTGSYGTLGTNLFYGPETAEEASGSGGSPVDAVFVNDYGGPAPSAFCDAGTLSDYCCNVQVLVRGTDYTTTIQKADDMLHYAQTETITNYYSVLSTQSSPQPLGQNSHDHWRFVFNVQMHKVEA